MVSDSAADGRNFRRPSADFGFKWVSSSPSPAEVERLEACFPEVVRVPVEDLDVEMEGWLSRAVIARTYHRWVPADAYIREFRRAGVSGAIAPISLANRCHIFRFEVPEACSLVLNRPWVINGQAIGTEAWRPDFFPADDSIASALLWVRLPNLPMEFWGEGILRRILQPAGSLVSVDEATQAKNRGGFARVSIRFDLRCPLRPGARVQVVQGLFWQQFVFENLEGICFNCGSLHLDGSCSVPAMAEGVEPASRSIYGPWISAVRQRIGPAAPQGGGRRSSPQQSSKPASDGSAAGKDPSLQGWISPGKVARRRNLGSSMVADLQANVPNHQEGHLMAEWGGRGKVPVKLQRAGLKEKGKGP